MSLQTKVLVEPPIGGDYCMLGLASVSRQDKVITFGDENCFLVPF